MKMSERLNWSNCRDRLLTALVAIIFVSPVFYSAAYAETGADTVKFGINRSHHPHEYMQNGSAEGFNVDIINVCAQRLKISVIYESYQRKDLVELLRTGELDAVCLVHSHEREELFKFTDENVLDTKLAIIVRGAVSDVFSFNDLSWRTVAVEEGDITARIISASQPKAVVVPVASELDAMAMVAGGDIFSAFIDYHTALYYINRKFGDSLSIVGEPKQVAPRGIAFAPGREKLRDKFNKALFDLKSGGEYELVAEKWFGRPAHKPFPWKRVMAVVGILIATLVTILFFFFAWNRVLRNRIDKHTKDLAESEKFLNSVFNGIQDGLSVLDGELNVVQANRAMHEWYSFREPIIGKKCYEAYHGKSQICDNCPSMRTLYSGNPDYQLVTYADENGKEGFLDLFTSPMKNENGETFGVIEYVRDATERELSRREIERAKREWENIFESISDPTMILDLDNGILDANRAILEKLGNISKEEIIGKKCSIIFHNSPDTVQKCPMDKLKETGGAETVEMEVEAFGGWYLVTTAPVYDESGKLAKAIHISKDVTERKKSVEALEESEARFHGIVDNAGFGVAMQREGKIFFANEMAHSILGCRSKMLNGKHVLEMIDPDCINPFITIEEAFKKNGRSIDRFELGLTIPGGKKVFLDIGVSRIPYEGEMVNIFSFVDITERKTLEEQLLQAQKMEAIGRLAGGIAHDFNNMLTAITGYCDLLSFQMDEDDSRRSNVDEIMRAANRAAELIKQLLSFSRKQVEEPSLVDLSEVVDEFKGMLERILGENMELKIQDRPGIWLGKADRGQIEQVILNLAVNARDSMPQGGNLTIDVENITLDEEYSETHLDMEPGDYVMFSVTDSGEGMDAETRRRAFDPFFTTKAPGKGTGLGLSMVYGIVHQFGGHVWLYSEVGYGTTVKIYLPRADENSDAVKDEISETAEVPTGSETLLVVEDDEQVLELMKEVLGELGYNVLAAADGEEALDICNRYEGDIHLLLTDVVLPKLNGPQVAVEFVNKRPESKIVYVSGYSEKGVIENGLIDSGSEVFQKPFTASSLAHKVREVLDS